MTIEQIRSALKTMKDAGSSKLPLPLNVVEQIISDAEQFRRLPQIAKDAAREMAR